MVALTPLVRRRRLTGWTAPAWSAGVVR